MFELRTRSMTPRERRDWWRQNPSFRGPEDLGPEMPTENRVDRVNPLKTEFIDEPEDFWYNTGSITNGLAGATVNRYNIVLGVKT